MKKINLFYLLFALSSFHSLSAADSDITQYLELKFWESFIFKYKRSLDQKSISFMALQTNEWVEYFILRENPKLPSYTLKELEEKLKNHITNSLSHVLYLGKNGYIKVIAKNSSKLKAAKIDDYLNNSSGEFYLKKAVQQGKGYEFSVDNNDQLEVKSFNIWEYNYRGIFTLLAIPLALVLGTLYSLGFFSSSETEKKDEIKYIV